MFPSRLIWCVLVLFCCSGHFVLGKDSGPPATGDTQLFAWFDRLGIEDFSHAKIVRVRTGLDEAGRDPRSIDEPRGFLLWKRNGQFRVLLGDLTVAAFEARGKEIGWRAVSLEEETTTLLKFLADERWDARDFSSQRLSLPGQAFVLARYCAAQGRDDLATRLLQAVSHAFQDQHGAELQEVIADDMSRLLRWRATLALVDPSQDRHALAALFRNIIRDCPKCRDAEWVVKTAEDLEQMAAEDDAYRKIDQAQLEHLGPAEQARELAFQLRDDYRVDEGITPEGCRPWPVPPTKGNGAFQKLVALGLPAVPVLLEAAKDHRPSRSVSRGVDWEGKTYIRSVRDLALEAIGGIAGVDFFSLSDSSRANSWEEACEKTRSLIDDWWKTTQEKGDVAWLRARVVAGTDGATTCLAAIAERHPEMLVPLARSTIPKINDPQIRSDMLEQVRMIKTPEVNQLLLDELARGPTVSNRVAAAFILRERHQPEPLGSMLAELAALPPTALNAAFEDATKSNVNALWDNPPDSPVRLVGFLISSDSTLALGQIRKLLPQCNARVRAKIIEAYAWRLDNAAGQPDIEPAGKELRQAVASLLTAELNDDGMNPDFREVGLEVPGVAEIAAGMLAQYWPDQYHFDRYASAETRASQLAKIRAQAQSAPPKTPAP